MSQEQSPKLAADLYVKHEKTLTVAALLAFAGGYLDAYSWIVHRVFANAQTANLVFLWIYGASGEWAMAFHYAPPLVSFMIGVITAFWLRRVVGVEAGRLSMLLEIAFLVIVAVLHNRLPDLAGTLGISFVAAVQAASFPRVENWSYSSVMATTNFRQAIEGLLAAISDSSERRSFRYPSVFGAICVSFGFGAAIGAYVTARVPNLTLGIPVTALLVALLTCERRADRPTAS